MIAQLKDDYLVYYATLPMQKLAADFISRSPDRADSLMLAYATPPEGPSFYFEVVGDD